MGNKQDKKKDSKKAKSQGEVVTEAMANVTGNAEAAKAALKAGKKLAKERIQLEDPILSLSAPRPVEIVEPQEPQRSVLTAYDKPGKKEQKARLRAAVDELGDSQDRLDAMKAAGLDKALNYIPGEPADWVGEPVQTTSNGGAVELTPESMAVAEPNEPLAEVTTETQSHSWEGGVPSSAEPRTRTDNLLVLLKQAQESADLDNLPQMVECPRKYVTKNYGVQLVKKYAPEGINAEATEDTFVPPDRDHPKGMWQVTLRIKPSNADKDAKSETAARYSEIVKRSVGANLDAADVSTSDLPKPEKVKAPKSDKKKGKKGKK